MNSKKQFLRCTLGRFKSSTPFRRRSTIRLRLSVNPCLAGLVMVLNCAAQSVLTVHQGAPASLTAYLKGNAHLINRGVLTNPANFTLLDAVRVDNHGQIVGGNCNLSGGATFYNRGEFTGNFNATASTSLTSVSVRNEGTLRGNVNQTNGRLLNRGVITNANLHIMGTGCITNEGVVYNGNWHLLNNSLLFNQGTLVGGTVKLDAFNGEHIEFLSCGSIVGGNIDADTFSPKGTGFISIDLSGNGVVTGLSLNLFANVPVSSPPLTNSDWLRLTCSAGAGSVELNSLTTGTAGTGNTLIEVLPGARLAISSFNASGRTTLTNSGTLIATNMNLTGASVWACNAGALRGTVNQTNGRLLNRGVIETNSSFHLMGTVCVTNEGVAYAGNWHLLNNSVLFNRGTLTAPNIKLDAFNGEHIKFWNRGRIEDGNIDADIFSPQNNASISMDLSGDGRINMLNLFAYVPTGSPPPTNTGLLRLTCSPGSGPVSIGALTTGISGMGKVLVEVLTNVELQTDTLAASGGTTLTNGGTLTVSNLNCAGSTAIYNAGTATAETFDLRDSAQAGNWGNLAATNLTLQGNAFFQNSSNLVTRTVQVNATNGANVGVLNSGWLRSESLRLTVTSPANSGFINLQNGGVIGADEVLLVDDVRPAGYTLFGRGEDLITFSNSGSVTGRLFSASTAGSGQINLNLWKPIGSEQLVTNGNVQITAGMPAAEPAILPEETITDARIPGEAAGDVTEVVPELPEGEWLDGGIDETSPPGASPRSNGPKGGGYSPSPDSGYVSIPTGAEAAFDGVVYGTITITNQGAYTIPGTLRLCEQAGLMNGGALQGGEIRLGGQAYLTNTGTLGLQRLQMDTLPDDEVAVRNSGVMHVETLMFSAAGAAVVECSSSGLLEVGAAWLGAQALAPFTLTNGQSRTVGGVRFITSGDGAIRVGAVHYEVRILELSPPSSSLTWSCDISNAAVVVETSDSPLTNRWFSTACFCVTAGVHTAQIELSPTNAQFFRLNVGDRTMTPAGMALVPDGWFRMGGAGGSGLPGTAVRVSSFFMDETEVTVSQMRDVLQWAFADGAVTVGAYDASSEGVYNSEGDRQLLVRVNTQPLAAGSGLTFSNGVFAVRSGFENLPCAFVSWYGALAYCAFKSDLDGLNRCIRLTDWTCDFTEDGYRLPTEAEWEKAARGALASKMYPWGDASADVAKANFGSHMGSATNTASYPANAFGLHDMAGNLAEWCWDSSPNLPGTNYVSDGAIDPTGPETGECRVSRGGAWNDPADRLSCSRRAAVLPASVITVQGFRTVRR